MTHGHGAGETEENRSLFNRIILGGLPGPAPWHAVDETPLGSILFTGYHHSSRSPPYGEEDSRFSLAACFLSISWCNTVPFNYFGYTRQWLPCPSVGRSTHRLDLPNRLSKANLTSTYLNLEQWWFSFLLRFFCLLI